MNETLIRNEVRKRVIEATKIDPLTQLKLEGKRLNTEGLSLFISEYTITGEIRNLSNRRSKIDTFMIQYDICVPSGAGFDAAETVCQSILQEFDLDNLEKSAVSVSGMDVMIRQVKEERAESSPFNIIHVLLTMRVSET